MGIKSSLLDSVLNGTRIALQSPLGMHEAEADDAPSAYATAALDLWTFVEQTPVITESETLFKSLTGYV